MNDLLNGPSKLDDFPLGAVGDQIVAMLQGAGIENPALMLAIADCDTGEMISTANLTQEDMMNFLKLMVQKHEEKAFDYTPGTEETKQ
jgi:hypothetical protein